MIALYYTRLTFAYFVFYLSINTKKKQNKNKKYVITTFLHYLQWTTKVKLIKYILFS